MAPSEVAHAIDSAMSKVSLNGANHAPPSQASVANHVPPNHHPAINHAPPSQAPVVNHAPMPTQAIINGMLAELGIPPPVANEVPQVQAKRRQLTDLLAENFQ
eukprot:425256_1